jgi:hypothetical protein
MLIHFFNIKKSTPSFLLTFQVQVIQEVQKPKKNKEKKC